MDYVYYANDYDYLYLSHHGILGQKWGVRRYQNEDGSYTEAGLKRRKVFNSALAVAGGVGIGTAVALGTGNPLAAKIAAGASAGTIKSTLDARAENKRNKNYKKESTKDKNALDEYYDSDKGKTELKNYANKNTLEKTKSERDKAYNNLVNKVEKLANDPTDSNMKESFEWFAGSDKPKVIADKLIKAEKNLNEYIDPDCSVFQQLPEEAMEGYRRGYLSKKQFDNIYEKEIIDTLSEYRTNDFDSFDMLKDALDTTPRENENRFTSWYGNGPENPESIKHYMYLTDSIYT